MHIHLHIRHSIHLHAQTSSIHVNHTHAGIVGAPTIPTYIKQSEAFPVPQSAHTDRKRDRDLQVFQDTGIFGLFLFVFLVWETKVIWKKKCQIPPCWIHMLDFVEQSVWASHLPCLCDDDSSLFRLFLVQVSDSSCNKVRKARLLYLAQSFIWSFDLKRVCHSTNEALNCSMSPKRSSWRCMQHHFGLCQECLFNERKSQKEQPI